MTQITFEVPDGMIEQMEALAQDLGLPDGLEGRKALLENALALIDWVVEQKKKGYVIASVDETSGGGYFELHMPALSRVRKDPSSATRRLEKN